MKQPFPPYLSTIYIFPKQHHQRAMSVIGPKAAVFVRSASKFCHHYGNDRIRKSAASQIQVASFLVAKPQRRGAIHNIVVNGQRQVCDASHSYREGVVRSRDSPSTPFAKHTNRGDHNRTGIFR